MKMYNNIYKKKNGLTMLVSVANKPINITRCVCTDHKFPNCFEFYVGVNCLDLLLSFSYRLHASSLSSASKNHSVMAYRV